MKCPIDQVDLVMADRQGIEIDYCPKCRGVWLDRGELDKLIERATVAAAPVAPAAPASFRRDHDDDDDRRPYDDRYQGGGQQPYRKRKKSFLGELFDF